MEDYEYLERQLEGKADGKAEAEPEARHGNGTDAVTPLPESGDADRRRSKSDSKRSRSRDKDRKRRSRSRDRGKDSSRDRNRDRDSRRRSRSRDRHQGGHQGGGGRGGRDPFPYHDNNRGRENFRRRERTPPEERLAREQEKELKEMERATRTVFAYNLNLKADERDIFKFFTQAGTVNDIQLITDKNTKRSKGMAYIEFKAQESVFMAISTLNGQLFMNMPLMIKASEVEKNLAWEAQQAVKQQQSNADAASNLLSALGGGGGVPAGLGSCRLQVNNLHPNLEDVDLKDAFEPFGFLELIQVARDPSTGQSLGYGFVQYREFSDGVKAMQHWNGKQLGARALEVQMAQMPAAVPTLLPPMGAMPPGVDMLGMNAALAGLLPPGSMPGMQGLPPAPAPGGDPYANFMMQQMAAQQQGQQQHQINELDEVDDEGKGGLKMDAQRRVALMQRLAGAAGMETRPQMIMQAVPPAAYVPPAPQVSQTVMLDQGLLGPASPIPTPAILLKNMFDPAEEEARGEPNWVAEVESDVKEECSRFGEVHHIHVDRKSRGFVYVKFAQLQGAEAAHRALNLRWYSGKQILVEYQFVAVYNSVFGAR